MEPCPICQEQIQWIATRPDIYSVTCPRCGKYEIIGTAIGVLQGTPPNPRMGANVSGWLRENEGFRINIDNLRNLRQLKTPSFHERADKILLKLERTTTYAGECIQRDKSWISWGWCLNDDELNEIIDYLKSSTQRISPDSETLGRYHAYKITADGWEHLEELKQINAESEQGFVAIWFDDSMQEVYDKVIAPAIYEAGYRPHRVDQREHNNKIDDEIIAEIRRSRFILADFTGHRGGVYYEAGFAKGLGLEVFWTCRKDEIDKLHFDIRQYNCIDWEEDKLEEFKRRITYRIESVVGQGTYRKAPTT